MRLQIVSLLFLLATLSTSQISCAQTAPAEASPRYVEALDETYGDAILQARELIHARMADFPGLSVAVGHRDRIIWSEGFGWADLEQRVPVRPSSRFRVGSVAKPMTAALLALLYEEGKIDLDAPVQQYVPSFPEKEYPITTRQLAGHLAGIRHYKDNEFLSAKYYPTVLEGLEIFADDPLLFEPGTEYSYSSYGWNLISAVLEAAGGADFLDQMEKRVFQPLGMRATKADQNRFIVSDRVRPYVVDGEGRFANAPYVDNSYKWAGGGFVSTPEDLVRFAQAHLHPGFLREETLRLLHTSQKTRDGKETGYGLGWRIAEDQIGHRFGHGGGSVGGRTDLRVYPELDLVVAMVVNLTNGAPLPAEEVALSFSAAQPDD